MFSAITLALAGDVMLGRLVNETISGHGYAYPWGNVIDTLNDADLFLINLECALTARTHAWHDGAAKEFYFRADPPVIETLRLGGVDFASLANNHAGDFCQEGLIETVKLLDSAGIKHAGAGANLAAARAPARLEPRGLRIAVVSFADHQKEWAASPSKPGINYTPVSMNPDDFKDVQNAITDARYGADFVIFSIHWGLNMSERPSKAFREFARAVIDCGADVFWGHSAHLVHATEMWHGKPIMYDTGDFVDDYAVDDYLRNDLGALFLLNLRERSVESIEVLPVKIGQMQVNRAEGPERKWFLRRFGRLCREMGTEVTDSETGVRISLSGAPADSGAGRR